MENSFKKCAVCGKIFDTHFFVNYAYKKSVNGRTEFYCGYNCMRAVEKIEEELNKDDNKQCFI